MSIAHDVATDSKCVSLQVGCVLVKDGHIISTGVNGTPKGYVNCNSVWSCRCPEHSAWSEKFEIHAEMNAIGFCPVSVEGSTAYVTHSPCFPCVKHMIAFGIKHIIYAERYYRSTDAEIEEIEEFCRVKQVSYNIMGD
jgi:dCMP deaminase